MMEATVYRAISTHLIYKAGFSLEDDATGAVTLIQRFGSALNLNIRQGLLEQDTENAWLDLDPAEDNDAMPQILGSSVSYRIVVAPKQGRKAFMIRTILRRRVRG